MLNVIVISGDNPDDVAKLAKVLIAEPIAVHTLALSANASANKAEAVAESLTNLGRS